MLATHYRVAKETVQYVHNGVWFSHEEQNYVICKEYMELATIMLSQTQKGKTVHIFFHACNLIYTYMSTMHVNIIYDMNIELFEKI